MWIDVGHKSPMEWSLRVIKVSVRGRVVAGNNDAVVNGFSRTVGATSQARRPVVAGL